MRQSYWPLILLGLIPVAAIIEMISSPDSISLKGILQFGILLVVVGFGIFAGFTRMKSAMRGEPAEDELSKKIVLKASSYAFYFSIYLWLAIMYFSDRIKLETHSLIGAGIFGMALLFVVCWLFFKVKGLKDE
jgi:hypothetical protein